MNGCNMNNDVISGNEVIVDNTTFHCQLNQIPPCGVALWDDSAGPSLHSEAVLWRNSPPNKYYDYYYSVNGHEWVEWGVQVNLWNMGVFLQLVWKRRNWPKLVNSAHEKCHGISLCIWCSWIFDLGMDCIWNLVVRFLYYNNDAQRIVNNNSYLISNI